MSWIVVKRRPTDQFMFALNGSTFTDCAKEARAFVDEDKAIAAMMTWGLSGEEYFITEKFGFDGGCSKKETAPAGK